MMPHPVLLRSAHIVLLAVLAGALATELRAENWPQWRGARGDGVSHEKNLPVTWNKMENVAWRLPLPGAAGSTPVVWGDHIFLTSAAGNDLVLLCIDTSGKELWRKVLGTGNRVARGDESNLASPSPSTDGKHVFAFVGSGDLACYDFAGKEVWKFNVQDRYGKFEIQFGMSSTPVLDRGRLYLQLIHGEGNPKTREALVVALDAATGGEIWKQPRPSEAYGENEHSYASPVLYRDDQREYLLTHGADCVVAHSLKDGHEIWRSRGLQRPEGYDATLRFVASPGVGPGLIVVPSAKKGRVLAIRADAQGDVTESTEYRMWTFPVTPDVPSPLIYDGLVYLCRENGNLIVLEAKTGKQYFESRTHANRHRASPVLADGKLYITSRDGVVSVVKTGTEFELLASNDLKEDIAASPAISNGRIYLRTYEALWAIENGKKLALTAP